ncbi:MAG: hypothetical protein HKN37_04245 [Rhodothermales bacterium]|nr:hypothetical protein [Rhodothermales bacterium]
MEQSYAEKSAWVLLVTLLVAFGWYFYSHGGALVAGSLTFGDMLGALIGLVVLIVVVEVTFHVMLGIEAAHDSRLTELTETDERDDLIDVKSERFASFVLATGAVGGIFSAAFLTAVMTAHVLLLALVLAESAKLISKLAYYRRGV